MDKELIKQLFISLGRFTWPALFFTTGMLLLLNYFKVYTFSFETITEKILTLIVFLFALSGFFILFSLMEKIYNWMKTVWTKNTIINEKLKNISNGEKVLLNLIINNGTKEFEFKNIHSEYLKILKNKIEKPQVLIENFNVNYQEEFMNNVFDELDKKVIKDCIEGVMNNLCQKEVINFIKSWQYGSQKRILYRINDDIWKEIKKLKSNGNLDVEGFF